jgi:CheY-like chemotaxis protein
MAGLEVLRAIRVEGASRDSKVIVVTVVAERSAVGGVLVHDMLPKPLNSRALVGSLERAGVSATMMRPILVVDDEPDARALMAAALTQGGYRPICASDGRSALGMLDEIKPQAMVLDLMMPEMDGFEVLIQLRERPEYVDLPVIIWTAKDLTPEDDRRLRASARAICHKGSPPTDALRNLIAVG